MAEAPHLPLNPPLWPTRRCHLDRRAAWGCVCPLSSTSLCRQGPGAAPTVPNWETQSVSDGAECPVGPAVLGEDPLPSDKDHVGAGRWARSRQPGAGLTHARRGGPGRWRTLSPTPLGAHACPLGYGEGETGSPWQLAGGCSMPSFLSSWLPEALSTQRPSRLTHTAPRLPPLRTDTA